MRRLRLEFLACELLPKLSWVAELRRGGDVVRVLHGPWVETRDDRFFEGAWDGQFAEGAFDEAVSFLGSGGRLVGERVVFAGPTHKMDRVQSVKVGDALYFSNSLVLLLTRAGEDLDLGYANYFFDYLNFFRKGIGLKIKPLRLRSANRALLHDCCNVAVSRDLAIERIEKPAPPEPSCYRDYLGFLEKTARDVAANAADAGRIHRFEAVVAISRGYDSVAVAALASRAGCRRAVTFRHSGRHSTPDSGTEIAAALGMEVVEYNRLDYVSLPGLPETEFYQYAQLAAKAQILFEDRIGGSLFFNGQAGEDYWNRINMTGLPSLREPNAFTMSGANLTEYRCARESSCFPWRSAALFMRRRSRASVDCRKWSAGRSAATTTARSRAELPRRAACRGTCSGRRRSAGGRKWARSDCARAAKRTSESFTARSSETESHRRPTPASGAPGPTGGGHCAGFSS